MHKQSVHFVTVLFKKTFLGEVAGKTYRHQILKLFFYDNTNIIKFVKSWKYKNTRNKNRRNFFYKA